MKPISNMDHLKAALRNGLCKECEEHAAPKAVATEPGITARKKTPDAKCEGECVVFANLPRLARLVKQGEPPCGYAVFGKSIDRLRGELQGPDIVHALQILEAASVATTPAHCGDESGCKRVARIATELECLKHQNQREAKAKHD